MLTECPRCIVCVRPGNRWHATGRFVTKNKLGTAFIAAELTCEAPECKGRTWTSGLRDAIAAGQSARESCGERPYELGTVDPPSAEVEPQPKMLYVPPRKATDLTPVGAFVQDYKKLSAGDE